MDFLQKSDQLELLRLRGDPGGQLSGSSVTIPIPCGAAVAIQCTDTW
jgi:hypothetical protein